MTTVYLKKKVWNMMNKTRVMKWQLFTWKESANKASAYDKHAIYMLYVIISFGFAYGQYSLEDLEIFEKHASS